MAEPKRINLNDFYRLKIQEFINRLNQIRVLIKHHNVSIGVMGEYLLREFLKELLPKKVAVCQGFIEYRGQLSPQCDVILFDSYNYPPLYSCGEIKIIRSESVYSVIEVKSSVNSETFGKALCNCKKLHSMGVNHVFFFIYDGRKVVTMVRYFQNVCSICANHKNEAFVIDGDNSGNKMIPSYDKDDFCYFPDAILSLSPDYCLEKEYISVDGMPDSLGYMAYSIEDNTNKQIACVQLFVDKIYRIIHDDEKIISQIETNELLFNQRSDEDNIKDMNIIGGFPICEM